MALYVRASPLRSAALHGPRPTRTCAARALASSRACGPSWSWLRLAVFGIRSCEVALAHYCRPCPPDQAHTPARPTPSSTPQDRPDVRLSAKYAVESEIAGLPRVKGRLTRVHSIYWWSMGPTPSAAAGPTTTMGCSTHVPTLKAPRATLSLRGHQFQLWCEVRGWRGVRNG